MNRFPLLLLVAAACSSNPTSKVTPPEVGKTSLEGIDVRDTTEDPAYAAAGEDLAHQTASNFVGQPAPLAVVQTIDGETIDLSQCYGRRPVYIKFWATWCIPCRQQMPGLQKAFEKHGADVQFIAVNIGLSDDEASVRALRDKYGLTMPIVIDDGRLAASFRVNVTPQHVLIGRDVRIAYVGHAENKNLDAALTRVIAGQNAAGQNSATPAQAAPALQSRAFRIGDVVQGIEVTTTTGETIAVGGPRPGKIRAVEFFASWGEWYLEKTRPGTAQASARVRQAVEAIAAKDTRVEWLGIAGGPWSTTQDLADYQKNNNVSISLALDKDGSLFGAFGIRDIPTIVLIDANGRLAKVVGPNDADVVGAIAACR